MTGLSPDQLAEKLAIALTWVPSSYRPDALAALVALQAQAEAGHYERTPEEKIAAALAEYGVPKDEAERLAPGFLAAAASSFPPVPGETCQKCGSAERRLSKWHDEGEPIEECSQCGEVFA